MIVSYHMGVGDHAIVWNDRGSWANIIVTWSLLGFIGLCTSCTLIRSCSYCVIVCMCVVLVSVWGGQACFKENSRHCNSAEARIGCQYMFRVAVYRENPGYVICICSAYDEFIRVYGQIAWTNFRHLASHCLHVHVYLSLATMLECLYFWGLGLD